MPGYFKTKSCFASARCENLMQQYGKAASVFSAWQLCTLCSSMCLPPPQFAEAVQSILQDQIHEQDQIHGQVFPGPQKNPYNHFSRVVINQRNP